MEELFRNLWLTTHRRKLKKQIQYLEDEMVKDPDTIQENLSTYESLQDAYDHGIRVDDGVEPATIYIS